ncbi:hypothetical protein [Brevibacillus sp. MS2.2]|uniref:hypothetical protein n=1 Tax=Brevibacillus sp. MS2.2 TaxID=2738981 RepID=UPI00156B6571|nr:hypothetical protein [Brevibacillus sp. MS2.2]NRR20987.1 hypothetical protein [Brevibacillus sp. MS2.2]
MIENKKQLTFGDRNSRLLLVISSIGVTFYLFKLLLDYLSKSYQSLYINDTRGFILGGEHILFPLILSSISFLLWHAFSYCVSEFTNFGNFEKVGIRLEYEEKADKNFRSIVGMLVTHFLLTLTATVLILIYQDSVILCMVLIGALILTSYLTHKYWLSIYQTFFNRFLPNQNLFINIIFPWIGLALSFIIIGLGTYDISVKGKSVIKFSATEVSMYFENKMPNTINVFVIDKNNKVVIEKSISKDDFVTTFLEISEGKENETNLVNIEESKRKFLYAKSKYEYNNKLDITEYLSEGTNHIVITFEIKSALRSSKHYKIVNQLNKHNNNKVLINKENITIEL